MRKILAFFIITICLSVSFVSCKKDKLLTDPSARLEFSQDSILFDTVFTTIGSTTRSFRVINKNNQKINISRVYLEHGQSSMFTLNVDGAPGKDVSDVEILANDSIYIFVQVNVNPTNQNSPLIIQDKILFDINGNQQSVALEAWGQDAYYHFPTSAIQFSNGYLPYSTVASSPNTTVTWNNDKPHVIYGWLVVDSLQKLIINQGVKVYFHQNAGLWVYRYGCLQVNGTQGNEVVFQGDRREADYADLPGQWDRIWINEGKTDNYINYAIIKNNYIGIQASMYPFFVPPNSIYYDINAPKRLKVTNTIIRNCARWGLAAEAFTLWSGNNVICNSKEYCGNFTLGGRYTFIQTTFANYFNQDGGRGGQPCVHLDNGSTGNYWALDSAYFGNCIIYGSQANEMEISVDQASPKTKNYKFENSLLKTTSAFSPTIAVNCLYNGNPAFSNPSGYDYKLNTNSAAINLGNYSLISINPVLQSDIIGQPRTGPFTDAGAYNH